MADGCLDGDFGGAVRADEHDGERWRGQPYIPVLRLKGGRLSAGGGGEEDEKFLIGATKIDRPLSLAVVIPRFA